MKFSRIPLLLALLAAFAVLFAGPGVRLGLWPFPVGFKIVQYAALVALVATVSGLLLMAVGKIRRTGLAALVGAVAIGGLAAGVPGWQMRQAYALPPIHDIRTDTRDPPQFVAVLPLRADAPNPAEYGGEEIAAQQRAAYPKVVPLRLKAPPKIVFAKALDSARAMGWEIVAADAGSGRIEATATTLMFGFKDDVVVRIRAEGRGSVVDVRSLSRVGRSDIGANARRIRTFMGRLQGS